LRPVFLEGIDGIYTTAGMHVIRQPLCTIYQLRPRCDGNVRSCTTHRAVHHIRGLIVGNMAGILGWILLGMLLTIFVRVILRIKDPDGMLVMLLLAIAGSLLGGLLAVAMGVVEYGDPRGVIIALVGAVTALALKAWALRYENHHS
jgi:uncharacterized membrane protein YeaQ/YmgE (transglycosylase-associated protein family)